MDQNYPYHNQKYFFKYYSAKTFKTVLKNGKYYYSSPLSFNDPFDIQTKLFFDFDKQTFIKKMFPKFLKLLEGKEKSIYKMPFIVNKLPSIEWEKQPQFKSIKRIVWDTFTKVENDYNVHWNNFLPKIRFFCLSEINDSILMWSHYSNNHTGVCVKLKVIPYIDNHLCAAKQVIYTKSPPSINQVFHKLTEKDWVNIFLGINPKTDTSDMIRFAQFKSDIWIYEKEWRVWFPTPIKDSLTPYSYKFDKREIETVFFGCNCNKKDIEEIKNIVKKLNVNVNFFQGNKNEKKYKIDFTEI